jgi:GNAT superfamily N-acetyltransferase
MSETGKTIEITRTYLQMTRPEQSRRAHAADRVRVERAVQCPASFFRYLYREVGRYYHWVDRLGWTDQEILKHLADPALSLFVMYQAGAPAGYFELQKHDDGSVEIAYFGLLPEFIGRGLGKFLLTEAIDEAWRLAPSRVWVHTCTLDDAAAMPNYIKRGFAPFKQETYHTTIAADEQLRGIGGKDEG